jgi:hypothetical protein
LHYYCTITYNFIHKQKPRPIPETNTDADPHRRERRARQNKERYDLFVETIRRYRRWKLTPAQQETVDGRLRSLAHGTQGFIPLRTKIMQYTSSYKAVEWSHITQSGALMHLLKGLLPQQEFAAFERFADYLVTVFSSISDVTSNDAGERARSQKTAALSLQSVEVLCELERYLPCTRFTPCLHNIKHFPQSIHRWNNVRNYWAFPMERYYLRYNALIINTLYTIIVLYYILLRKMNAGKITPTKSSYTVARSLPPT